MTLHSLLQNAYATRLSRNPRYSLRAFARDLGISAAGLSQVINKRQGVSPEKARLFGRRLGLSEAEIETLVLDATQAFGRSASARKAARKEIQRRSKEAPGQVLTVELFQAVSDWWHWALIEIAQIEDHHSVDSLVESAHRRIGLTPAALRDGVGRLLKLEILKKGACIKPCKDTRIVPAGIPSEAIRKLHQQMLEKAQNALAFQSIDERDFGASFVSIDPRALPLLKEKLRRFRREVIAEFGHDSTNPAAVVYCLNTQAFRVERPN